MADRSSNAANATISVSEKLRKMIASNSMDYDCWRSLILEIETATPEDIDTISLAYDSFLSKFPLCNWHLEKYVSHKAKLSGAQEAIKIFERGATVAMFSVGFWVDYFTFATTSFGDPEDVRRLFGRALTCVGRDYLCHVLWDKYMKYEFDQEGWSFLAQSYIEALRFPTKKLRFYYENFKQFVTNLEEEMEYENDSIEAEQVSVPCDDSTKMARDDISLVVKDLLNSADRFVKCKALDRYRSIGEKLYHEAFQLDGKIKCFETNIRRRYFSASPLDDDQLNNWHLYLDFIEKQDNLDWAVKLYERCLVPCANYPEFWMRYVEFLESKRGSDLCISALNRATQIFLKNVPEIHLFNVRFKEHIGDVDGARGAFLLYDTKSDLSFVENIVAKANMERRLGNLVGASATYEKALKTATEKQKLNNIPILYSQFARLTFTITGSADAARDVLIDGIKQVPRSKLLFEELIKFAMTHEGANQVHVIGSVVDDAISPRLDEYEGLTAKDRESVSSLFVEFVDLCGTIHDFMKAWNRHIKLFPQFLRVRQNYTPVSYSSDAGAGRAQKEDYNLTVRAQPPKDQYNHEIARSQILGIQLAQNVNNTEVEETQQALSEVALSLQSSKDKLEMMEDCTELANHTKENSIIVLESAHELSSQSEKDKFGTVDIIAESANQTKENTSSPQESTRDLGKSSRINEPELGSKFKQQKLNSPEKESQLPKSNDNSNSVDTPLPLNELEKDGSLNHHQNSTTMKMHEDKLPDKSGPPPRTASAGQSPLAAPPDSHPERNTPQSALLTSEQTLAMSQMLQYYYQQQQFMQQQYQQQQTYPQMQHQYMNQQMYQLQPIQQNYVQLANQQNYVQQQQVQSLPHPTQQNIQSFQNYGYQQQDAAQGNQILWQQYQQYQQGYQNLQHQPQSEGWHMYMQEQNPQQLSKEKEQDGLMQQSHQSQNQKGKVLRQSEALVHPQQSQNIRPTSVPSMGPAPPQSPSSSEV